MCDGGGGGGGRGGGGCKLAEARQRGREGNAGDGQRLQTAMCRPPEEEVTRISGCQLQPLKGPFSLPPFEQFTVLRFAYTNTKGGRESGGRERKTNIQRERERGRGGRQADTDRQTNRQREC